MRHLAPLLALLAVVACGPREPAVKPHQPPAPVAVAPVGGDTPAAVELAFTRGGAAAPGATTADHPAPEPIVEAQLPDGDDVTAQVRELNSDKYAAPPTTFRPGHVTPRQLSPDALARRADGFALKLPSGAPITTPAFYDGKIYVSGGFRSKEFYAVDATTGRFAWGLDLDDDGPSAPACAEGVCAFDTESCTLFVVDAKTGAQRWSLWLGDPLTSSPTIASGRVFTSYPAGRGHGGLPQQQQLNSNANPLGNAAPQQQAPTAPTAAAATPPADGAKPRPPGVTHALAAFDLQTGKILWQVWIDSDVLSAPVAVGTHLYATSFAGTLYKLDQATGRIEAARKIRATSAPVVAATGDIYYTRRDDKAGEAPAEVVVRAGAGGRAKWVGAKKTAAYLDHAVQSKSELAAQAAGNDAANGFAGGAPAAANPKAALGNVGQSNVFSMQAFQGSRVLATRWGNVNTMGDEVVCTDPATGEKRWTHKLSGDLAKAGGFLAAPPAEAGGHVFVGTLAGEVLQLDPTSGAVQRRFAVGHPVRSQPVVEGGWLYVGTDDGHLVGIDTGDAALTGWPQWGADAARTGAPRG